MEEILKIISCFFLFLSKLFFFWIRHSMSFLNNRCSSNKKLKNVLPTNYKNFHHTQFDENLFLFIFEWPALLLYHIYISKIRVHDAQATKQRVRVGHHRITSITCQSDDLSKNYIHVWCPDFEIYLYCNSVYLSFIWIPNRFL